MSRNQHPFGNAPDKVERYCAFWRRDAVARPLVGFSYKSWFPLEEFAASRAWQDKGYLTPEMIDPESFLDDQERLLAEGETLTDDILRGASPSQAVPWLDGMLGANLCILPGSILGQERCLSWDELRDIHLDRDNPWYRKYMAFIDTLVHRSAGRYPVSPSPLIGPSDLAAMLRGHTQFVLDLVSEPRCQDLLQKLGDVFVEITRAAWSRIPLFYGGYFDAQYALWAPGPIVRLQEDATGLFSPSLYRKVLQPIDRMAARQFTHAFMHIHPTSLFLLDAFLEVEEIRCFQVNYEPQSSGLALADMIPYLRRIQQAGRPLVLRGSFTVDEARLLMDQLDSRGLYVYVMVGIQQDVEALSPVLGL